MVILSKQIFHNYAVFEEHLKQNRSFSKFNNKGHPLDFYLLCRLVVSWSGTTASCPPPRFPASSGRSRPLVGSSSQPVTTLEVPVETLGSSSMWQTEVRAERREGLLSNSDSVSSLPLIRMFSENTFKWFKTHPKCHRLSLQSNKNSTSLK